jgi:hypothetical protein
MARRTRFAAESDVPEETDVAYLCDGQLAEGGDQLISDRLDGPTSAMRTSTSPPIWAVAGRPG